jgi:hypothetical protein
MEATQLQPRWGCRHHDPAQRLHVLVGNLDQPARGVGADPPQRAAATSVEQTVDQSGRDAGNGSNIISTVSEPLAIRNRNWARNGPASTQ